MEKEIEQHVTHLKGLKQGDWPLTVCTLSET